MSVFSYILQNPIVGNGQCNIAFWERITKHFNQTKPYGSPMCSARSLETNGNTLSMTLENSMVHTNMSIIAGSLALCLMMFSSKRWNITRISIQSKLHLLISTIGDH